MQRVAITDLGVVSALGIGATAFWDALKHGRSGTCSVTLFDKSLVSVPIAAEVPDFDPERELPGVALDILDRFSQLALVAAREAVLTRRWSSTTRRAIAPACRRWVIPARPPRTRCIAATTPNTTRARILSRSRARCTARPPRTSA
jgi:3-oxoacyl-(acyl-carrier-protein) synthase